MRTIRLLPVVVGATCALLALKTVSLVTNGGYVLSPQLVLAQEDLSLPETPTIEDGGVTIEDEAPTMRQPAPEASGAEGGEEAAGEAPEEGTAAAGEAVDAGSGDETPEAAGPEAESACGDGLPNQGVVSAECLAEQQDAEVGSLDVDGEFTPLSSDADGVMTERTLLDRLAERRNELEAYAQELEMREALIEAAEQRIEERAQTMETLEARIDELVAERDAAESDLLTGVVSMYESMRPKDAATIFNELDRGVLVPLAKAIAPRKMAMILAEMNPARAQELTVAIADISTAPRDEFSAQDLEELPQIVGQ
ncbi:hypothetical protein GCM10007989_06640 [Devosia pacifica]|uniref:Magnesium transporter MgtE intracellular domain-containing protein n=1 Tax=Devosia pacifica TaxID=1335967 RepID=A0A918VQC6_9HYPH|nr:hypothetical protein [Devosia pacifica]GHA14613.1 hypothetical protein GCM10007989_06640 [Devosia pacifica]